MTIREAQVRCPDAAFLPPDDAATARVEAALLALLEQFSPLAEPVRPGVLLFDAAGQEQRHATEAALGENIVEAVRQALGAAARVGVAGGRFCARVAAAYGAPVRVIPAGEEQAFLAPLPVTHLPGLERWRWQLQFLGVRTIGEYAARLPYADVVVRYGPEAAQAHWLARGIDEEPLRPRRPPEERVAVQRCEPPEERVEPLIFLLKRHLDRCCAELEREGWQCGAVALRCRCEGADDVLLVARPAEPTAAAARLRDLLRWQLERRQTAEQAAGRELFGGGVTAFELRLQALTPAVGQPLNLFSGERAGRQNVVAAVERLEALLGPERVRRAVAADGRRPEERFGWAPFRPPRAAPLHPPRGASWRSAGQGAARRPAGPPKPTPADRVRPLPLAPVADGQPSSLDGPGPADHAPAMRLFDPPRPVQVRWRDGAPAAVAVGRGLEAVTTWTGPWQLDERWWASAAARTYYQAATRPGRVYLLFQEGEAWYAQGAFD